MRNITINLLTKLNLKDEPRVGQGGLLSRAAFDDWTLFMALHYLLFYPVLCIEMTGGPRFRI